MTQLQVYMHGFLGTCVVHLLSEADPSYSRKVATICDLLIGNYGEAIVKSRRPAMDVLVQGILSQNTNDINMGRAFDNLKAKYSTWEGVLAASEEELGEVIKSSGFYRLKARRIKATLSEINNRVGRLDLGLLKKMEIDEAMDWLTSLYGVGPKTAAILMLFHFGRPVLPVDTHVWRVAKRLGLVPDNFTREKTQVTLQNAVPQQCLLSMNHNLVMHGRQICIARNPRCDACFLRTHCDYYETLH
ncbi:MAG: endonuclease III domain-containing protein [Candidatus Thorarchaeota archaeon]|jgi:endonuclease-3